MKFKELRTTIEDMYIILDTEDGRFDEFNTRSERYDEHEVCSIQWTDKRIFVSIY